MAKHKITDFFKDANASSIQSSTDAIDHENSSETLSLVIEYLGLKSLRTSFLLHKMGIGRMNFVSVEE